jgi:hypothetical protein
MFTGNDLKWPMMHDFITPKVLSVSFDRTQGLDMLEVHTECTMLPTCRPHP